MTFNGIPMTNLTARCDNGADYICAQMYYLLDPPVGTYNVHLSFGTGGKIIAGVMTLYGIDQTNPVVGYSTDASEPASVNLTSQPGDIAVDILAGLDCGTFTQGSGQTERWDVTWTNPNWVRHAATSTEIATGTSVNMSYSGTYTDCDWGYVAALFRAAGNGIPTPAPTSTVTPTASPTVPTPPSGVTWRKYYFAGAQRIAMRVSGDPIPANNGVFYLLGDHLGGTNIVVEQDGETVVAELRYTAWGETRYMSAAPGTDYRYTGQREEAGIGLYYYRARWYDPSIARFAQADTVGFGDRYSYVRNNPTRFNDPSGHKACSDETGCDSPTRVRFPVHYTIDDLLRPYGITIKGDSQDKDKLAVLQAVAEVGLGLASLTGQTPQAAFQGTFGSYQVEFVDYSCETGCWGRKVDGESTLRFYQDAVGNLDPRLVVHELGHAFNAAWVNAHGATSSPYSRLGKTWADNPAFPRRSDEYNGYAGDPYEWQQSESGAPGEEYADMFLGWTYDAWATDDAGTARRDWMRLNMSYWLAGLLSIYP
jgi:RHS repeat-associated protein